MKQQQVHILGLRAQGYKSIEAVTLSPDLFTGKLVRVTGDIGNGKTSLMELVQIALSGSDAIAKKDALKTGFLSEVQILDGEHKLFMGVRVRDIERGESKGQPKFETFLFEKDKDGKQYVPVIDGRKATASDYMNMLHSFLSQSCFIGLLSMIGIELISPIPDKRRGIAIIAIFLIELFISLIFTVFIT